MRLIVAGKNAMLACFFCKKKSRASQMKAKCEMYDCVYECIGYLIDDDNDKLLNVFFFGGSVVFGGVNAVLMRI